MGSNPIYALCWWARKPLILVDLSIIVAPWYLLLSSLVLWEPACFRCYYWLVISFFVVFCCWMHLSCLRACNESILVTHIFFPSLQVDPPCVHRMARLPHVLLCLDHPPTPWGLLPRFQVLQWLLWTICHLAPGLRCCHQGLPCQLPSTINEREWKAMFYFTVKKM